MRREPTSPSSSLPPPFRVFLLTSTSSLASLSPGGSGPGGEKERPVFGERGASFGKAGLEAGSGFGERRQSFGKAGLGAGQPPQPGAFRERRGSISSLSGKEELSDYHLRQRDERLREQEVERLVSETDCITKRFHPKGLTVRPRAGYPGQLTKSIRLRFIRF